jgi:type VI secretion system protein ImpJ
MTIRPVHWDEGMFLRPHHLQASQRHWLHLLRTSEKWDHTYNWGLGALEVDQDALANGQFVVRTLRARLRDGTLVSVPEDNVLPALDLAPGFEHSSSLTIFLAVPILQLGRANLARGNREEGGRYLLDTLQLEDENTGVNPQPVMVRLLNLRLLLSTQDHSGYEVLPVARVQKSSGAEAVPQLDTTYIPPLLNCDAWPILMADILQAIYHRIGRLMQDKAQQVSARGITFESGAQGDAQIFARLRIYNEASTLLGVLAFLRGIHPLWAFVELCRLVGQLAIFGQTCMPPELPVYDHDDLGGCFYRLKLYIDELLDRDRRPGYEERPFIGAGLRIQVALEPVWLESVYQMFVGVRSPLPAQECVDMLTRPGRLDMKIGSSRRADEIHRCGLPGLHFRHAPTPPRALPAARDLTYFQVNREAQQEEWQDVRDSLSLAIRLNEHRIAGTIEGQRILSVRQADKTVPMQFTLYVLKQEGAS